MEVLISLGILSVGLASVVSLIPAGASQAKLSIIEDRRAALGYAAINDAVIRGILSPARWGSIPASPYAIAVDPLGVDVGDVSRFPASIAVVDLAGVAAGSPAADAVFRSADDLVYDIPQADDDPAIPRYFPGSSRRMSNGDFSWLATLLPVTAATDNQYYRLSVVCFYKRPVPPEASATFFTGSQADASSFSFSCSLSDDDFRSLFPRGTAVLMSSAGQPPVWRQVLMASPVRTAGTVTGAELMFDRPIPGASATTLYTFQGAIGVSEKLVALENASPWLQ